MIFIFDTNTLFITAISCILFDSDDCIVYNALIAGGGDDALMRLPGKQTVGGNKLTNILYHGYTLPAWALVLSNIGLFKKLSDKQLNSPLDAAGNRALHIAASCSSVDTVSYILSDKSVMVEAVNSAGNTPLMEGMKTGLFASLRFVAKRVADPRRGLERRYDAWLLALCRSRERRQKNLQTGQIQLDDEKILPMAPDPDYLFWYNV